MVTKIQMVDIDVFSSKKLIILQWFYLNPHCLHQFTSFEALFIAQYIKSYDVGNSFGCNFDN